MSKFFSQNILFFCLTMTLIFNVFFQTSLVAKTDFNIES